MVMFKWRAHIDVDVTARPLKVGRRVRERELDSILEAGENWSLDEISVQRMIMRQHSSAAHRAGMLAVLRVATHVRTRAPHNQSIR